jgi:hypothetical protein
LKGQGLEEQVEDILMEVTHTGSSNARVSTDRRCSMHSNSTRFHSQALQEVFPLLLLLTPGR